MPLYLGIDTSNYTTSVALYDSDTKQAVNSKKLLPVAEGAVGLRQGDAVFHHVRQLTEVLTKAVGEQGAKIEAIGVSVTPRPIEGSYMPCFLVGKMAAEVLSTVNHIPLYPMSHQCGHILAALYNTENLSYLDKPFIAFHFSGGTSECLYVQPDKEQLINITLEAASLDLKAGQLIDRVGNLLGIAFPAGMELDKLACLSEKQYKIRPVFKGADCCLSGVENQCQKMLKDGEQPCDIAKFAIQSVHAVCDRMTADALQRHPDAPVLFAGGVMSNSYISAQMKKKYQCNFAAPAFSSDNAVGAALFAYLKDTAK